MLSVRNGAGSEGEERVGEKGKVHNKWDKIGGMFHQNKPLKEKRQKELPNDPRKGSRRRGGTGCQQDNLLFAC